MKHRELKIKKGIRFEELPAYLRRLADALERKTENLPTDLADLPESITKLQIKGKPHANRWVLKIKIKTDTLTDSTRNEAADAVVPAAALSFDNPQIPYTALKKRMKSSFKIIGESLAARRLPEPGAVEAFLSDSELMVSFPGENFGEACYPAFRKACRQLAEAYETRNQETLNAAFATLGQLKRECHKGLK